MPSLITQQNYSHDLIINDDNNAHLYQLLLMYNVKYTFYVLFVWYM